MIKYKLIDLKKSKRAVSEVIATILLVGMAVVIFAVLYMFVLSTHLGAEEPIPVLVATVVGNKIIIEHRGGNEIDLDEYITFMVGDEKVTRTVGELLIDSNGNNKFDIGEKLAYEFQYNLSEEKAIVSISQSDNEGSELILFGPLNIKPESDLGVKCTIDRQYPTVGSDVTITIIVTNYRGDMSATGVVVEYILPAGLVYKSDTTTQGVYNPSTGDWDVGEIDIRGSATLTITVTVVGVGSTTPTQLAMLLDGSGSILATDWKIMLDGISLAIKNGYIPHDGSVELTVIQFGGWTGGNPGVNGGRSWAQVELGGPIVLTGTNYNTVATQIQGIHQLGGGTAMSCAFRLAADIMSGDPNNKLTGTRYAGMASTHSDWPRQVINLVTDGQPNIIYLDNERYKGWWPGSNAHPDEFTQGKTNTEAALAYYESLIPIEQRDEIDSEAVGTDTDIPWLRDHIVRPQPGYDTWPPAGSGWVRYVDDYTEFAETIDGQFIIIFGAIDNTMKIEYSSLADPVIKNNQAEIKLYPQEN